MTPDEMTTIVRDAMLALGGQTYEDTYAQEVKAQKHARARERTPRARRPEAPSLAALDPFGDLVDLGPDPRTDLR